MQFYTIYKPALQHFFLVMLLSLTVISCVTINIYFPAAAAEKAAEQIVDDVLKSVAPDAGQSTESNKPSENSQSLYQAGFVKESLLVIVDFVFPVAQASGAVDISINTPQIRAIRKSMEKRQAKLHSYYTSGAVGFTNNGLIASVSNKGLSIKQKSTVKKLIKAENKDRNALYAEIANANSHPEWRADIQKTFAKTWINKISSGWMYQNSSGQWQRKK